MPGRTKEYQRKSLQKLPKSTQEQLRQSIIRDYIVKGISIKDIAKKYKRRKDSIARTINTYKKRHGSARKKGSGSEKGLDPQDKSNIINLVTEEPHQPCQGMVNELKLKCSDDTVRRFLHERSFS